MTEGNVAARYTRWRWQIFGITWLAYAGFYLTRKSFSVAKVELMKPTVLGWTKGDLAWVDGAYLTTYAIGQFICGALGDRYGARKVILIGMMASVIVAGLMGASTWLVLVGALFAVQGFCQSTGWAPLTKNMGEFFSRGERGRVFGLWCSNYAIGGVAAAAIAGWSVQALGWRFAFWLPAFLLLCIWILFWFFQRDTPADVGLPVIETFQGEPEEQQTGNSSKPQQTDHSWNDVWKVVTNRMVLLLAAVYFLVKPMRYLVMFWSPVYIHERLGTNPYESGVIGSLFDLSGPISIFIGGWISDKVFKTRRMPVMVICLFGAGLLTMFFQNLPHTRTALSLGLICIGFLIYIPDSMASGTAAIDFGTSRGASTAAGIINGCGSIGAAVGGTIPGWVESIAGVGGDLWGIIFRILGVALMLAGAILLPKWNTLPGGPVARKVEPVTPPATQAVTL
jgi:OPA family glycerol-3-phosphate transporter-like MFS transporter